jgi:RHH-type rel operon transcriptional repressor/antitoxin RelB
VACRSKTKQALAIVVVLVLQRMQGIHPMAMSVSIRLPENIGKALDELAQATERSRTYLIVKALETYLEEYADYLIALERWRDKDDPIISSAEMRKRLARKS